MLKSAIHEVDQHCHRETRGAIPVSILFDVLGPTLERVRCLSYCSRTQYLYDNLLDTREPRAHKHVSHTSHFRPYCICKA